ncbi:MAG: hypothetical protein GX640_21980 [Fibrobacter sp.]|nr:hypothetical protein [Fibrobacter sp.]
MLTFLSPKKSGIFVILAGIYLVLLFVLFKFTQSMAVPLVGIILVSYISWTRGALAGLILTAINHFVNSMVFRFMLPDFSKTFPPEMFISILVYIAISFLLGYFGKLAKNLRKEIEKRIEVESSLRALQNELEQRVETRTRELEHTNQLLYQARKMEAIGQLVGTIAHDFNNFLSIILGYSTLLVKYAEKDSTQYEFAKNIKTTAETAAEMTSQLLTFARKRKFTLQSIDLNGVIKDILPLLSNVIKRGITIECVTEPDLPVFLGGVDLIKSAILNLSINARDAMKTGGTLTIITKTMQITNEFCKNFKINCSPGKYAALSIKDTGTGMTDEVLNHLFEPFFTTKEEGNGTGMGLAAVYGIMQSHKGAVYVETEVGKGTTFTMLFPAESKTPEPVTAICI